MSNLIRRAYDLPVNSSQWATNPALHPTALWVKLQKANGSGLWTHKKPPALGWTVLRPKIKPWIITYSLMIHTSTITRSCAHHSPHSDSTSSTRFARLFIRFRTLGTPVRLDPNQRLFVYTSLTGFVRISSSRLRRRFLLIISASAPTDHSSPGVKNE